MEGAEIERRIFCITFFYVSMKLDCPFSVNILRINMNKMKLRKLGRDEFEPVSPTLEMAIFHKARRIFLQLKFYVNSISILTISKGLEFFILNHSY